LYIQTQIVAYKLPPSLETFQGTLLKKLKAPSFLVGPADHNMSEVKILLPPGVVFSATHYIVKNFETGARLTVYVLFFSLL
jgi:hypothetical protein